jgi:nitrite reductase/ring-hydroxylating ferredoxin subunit
MAQDVPLPVLTPNGQPPEEQPKWRRDFPIDVQEDNHVARRDFTKFMVLVSFAFAVGQCWIWLISAWRRVRPKDADRRIAAVSEIPVGGAMSFRYPEAHDNCVLIRLDDAHFVAYGSKCTHLSCAVIPDVAAGVLHCPCHQGFFDLSSGQPLAGPPRRPLPRVQLKLQAGYVHAVGIEERTT